MNLALFSSWSISGKSATTQTPAHPYNQSKMIGKSTTAFMQVSSYDIDALREAFLEGRLYIQQTTEEKSETSIREKGIHDILQYVSRID